MKKPQIKAFSAKVNGRVQGVAFRYYTKNEADMAGITGWVRNNEDGSVEVWAEGQEDKLHAFLDWLSHGPSHARIDDINYNWNPVTAKYKTFSILY